MFNCHRYTKINAPHGNQFPALAWEFNVDNSSGYMSFRVARCSEEDNFSREIAKDVLNDRPFHSTHINRDISLVENAISCIGSLISGGRRYFESEKEYLFYKRVFSEWHMIRDINLNIDEARRDWM
jgi:hypothetical protein